MKDFINEDFLLQSDVAKMLYHEHAEKMPIIDSSIPLPKYGWVATIINGVQCVRMA